MKTIYILEQRIMNGTVTIGTTTNGFVTKELAELCAEKLSEQNKNLGMFNVVLSIKEMNIYDNIEECSCLTN